ncbi:MAG: hypothetical protein P1U63_04130 [Coxiellaceae bacterium]|nr:hypothetical protein [Coxiellaceae bacterium]
MILSILLSNSASVKIRKAKQLVIFSCYSAAPKGCFGASFDGFIVALARLLHHIKINISGYHGAIHMATGIKTGRMEMDTEIINPETGAIEKHAAAKEMKVTVSTQQFNEVLGVGRGAGLDTGRLFKPRLQQEVEAKAASASFPLAS